MPRRAARAALPLPDIVVLVLQGGGALGAFQAGVYEALIDLGIELDWVAGISIGAVNAAIIAGNPRDEAVAKMRGTGADLRVVGDGLAHAPSGHALLDPVSMIATAYLEIEQVAIALGRDPDRPRLLRKVTETL